ncbi:MAG: mannose-6-phosphate isomerase, class I, partial [Pseudomonadota bacterium]
AGVPHAYLEGQLIELMTSSDNVLRCGLTSKHVDPPAVLAHAVLEASPAHRVEATPREGQPGRMDYPCPVDDFLLSRWTLEPGQSVPIRQGGASILLVLDGNARIVAGDQILERSRGQAALSAGTTMLQLEANTAVDVFMASVPWPSS